MKNPRRWQMILLCSLWLIILSVYAVTFRPGQGWGDDFAQYLSQAHNLATGHAMADTGYLYSRYNPEIGPRAYPPGFPLLLVPVDALFGSQIGAFQVWMIVLQVAALVVIWLLYRREVQPFTALILLMLIGLSPYLIAFKREIMSDIPFMLACIGFAVWVEYTRGANSLRGAVVAGVLAFACYLIRTVGFVALAALLISDLLTIRRVSRYTVTVLGVALALALLAGLLFGGGAESYLDQFKGYSLTTLTNNVGIYLEKGMRGFWAGPSLPLGADVRLPLLWIAAIPLLIYGFIRRARSGTRFLELFFLMHLGVIIAWPSAQELRFLYPVLPLFILYAGIGFEGALEQLKRRIPTRRVLFGAGVVAALLVLIYAVRTLDVIADERALDYAGPYSKDAQELFAFVRDYTPADSVFVFYKARALAYYSQRDATTFPAGQDAATISGYLQEVGADYAVLKHDDQAGNVSMAAFVQAQPDAFREVYAGTSFTVYQIALARLVG